MIKARLEIPEQLTAFTSGRRLIERELAEAPSIKDLIESVGIPHTEVDLLTAAGLPLSWSDPVPDDVSVTLSPVPPATAESDVSPLATPPPGVLQPRPLARDRFLCDLHLGTLARLLRMLGLDTAWQSSGRESDMARVATNEDRAVLTRNRKLLMRKSLTIGLLLRSDDPDTQAREVLRRYGYASSVDDFQRKSRCSTCNGHLVARTLDEVRSRVPPKTAAWLDNYYLCQQCGKLFWEGTHYEKLYGRLAAIIAAAGGPI